MTGAGSGLRRRSEKVEERTDGRLHGILRKRCRFELTRLCLCVLLLSVPHHGLHKLLGFLGHSHESVFGLTRPEHSGSGVQVMTRPPPRSIIGAPPPFTLRSLMLSSDWTLPSSPCPSSSPYGLNFLDIQLSVDCHRALPVSCFVSFIFSRCFFWGGGALFRGGVTNLESRRSSSWSSLLCNLFFFHLEKKVLNSCREFFGPFFIQIRAFILVETYKK